MTEPQIPRAKAGRNCPLYKKDVSKVCHTCAWWVGMYWQDPKTQEPQHKWQCAQVMVALGNVDVVRAMAGVQAASESVRNVIAKPGNFTVIAPIPAVANGHAAHQIEAARPMLINGPAAE